MIAWMIAAVISVLVGVLLAPTALLSRDMMEPYMLLAFTAVVIGGLTSLYGVFVGGIIVGVVNNLMSLYFSSDAAVLAVFVLLLLVLGFRPQGIFGDREIERL
jgi:branched-chain amino acid transport system permease protein